VGRSLSLSLSLSARSGLMTWFGHRFHREVAIQISTGAKCTCTTPFTLKLYSFETLRPEEAFSSFSLSFFIVVYLLLFFVLLWRVGTGRDSSVGIATSYGLDGRGKICLFTIVSRPALGPTQPPIQWILGVKRSGREAGHSSPSSAKNGGAIPPLPHTSSWHTALLIKHRDNFTFFYLRLLFLLVVW
jgi:hypothetical protein